MRITLSLLIIILLLAPAKGQEDIASVQKSGNITGQVVSASSNQPMEGVEISVTGLEQNYLTDSAGMFKIPFDKDELWLVFRFPGHSIKELLVPKAGEYGITLFPETERSLDRPISPYFGSTARYKTSASEYLSMEQVVNKSHTTAGSLIQGRFAGLSATGISAMPGEGSSLQIRGGSSLFAMADPLIIVDGMPYTSDILENELTPGSFHNPLKSIDIEDIQQIELIKDGGALYGVRGGNGVIMITTRQPEEVTTKVNFSIHTGVTTQPEGLPLLNASQHKAYLVNQLQSSGLSFTEVLQQNQWISGNPSYYYYYNYANDTDWQDEIFRPAYMTKLNVGLEGGDEIARFAVLLGYMNQKGVVENSRYQRYNLRINSHIRILERLSMISNVGFSYHTSDLFNFGPDKTLNPILSALTKSPMLGPYLRDNEGTRISIFSDADDYGSSNPAVIINKAGSSSLESHFFTNLRLLYQPLPNLNVSNTTHVTFNNIRDNSFVPQYGIANTSNGEIQNSAEAGVYKIFNLANESRVVWKHDIRNRFFLTHIGGFRISSNSDLYNSGMVYNTPTDEFTSLSSVSLVENTFISGDRREVHYSDLFLQGGYRFKDKYLADLVLTLSASSTTGKEAQAINFLGGKWGFFPSVHGAWLVSSEPFLKSSTWLDLLKLRASYSVSGNDYYSMQSGYYYTSRTYGVNSGLVRTYLPNESLKWEELHQLNLGIDFHILRERVNLNIDIFSRNTTDLLTYRQINPLAGFPNQWENNGTLLVKGMELGTELVPLRGHIELRIGGQLGITRSTVDLDHDLVMDVPGGHIIIQDGESPFSYFGFQSDGIYQNSEELSSSALTNSAYEPFEAGDIRFVDQDGNKIIDEKDRINLGDMYPTLRAGTHLSFRVGPLTIYALAEFVGGNKIFNFTRMQLESFSGYENQSIAEIYAWRNESDNTSIPRVAYDDPTGNARFSDRWVEDGNYFRLRELTLSYDLKGRGFYNNIRIYVTGMNLITLSDYLGYDPEFSFSSNPFYHGIDYGQVPITPQFMLGLKVGF